MRKVGDAVQRYMSAMDRERRATDATLFYNRVTFLAVLFTVVMTIISFLEG